MEQNFKICKAHIRLEIKTEIELNFDPIKAKFTKLETSFFF